MTPSSRQDPIARSRLGALACLAALVGLAACGQWRMMRTEEKLARASRAGDFGAALATLRAAARTDYGPEDRVMYWMNEGMLLHLVGEHRASIESLHRAEELSRELFTQSISEHMSAAFTSDAALSYQGEDHEKVLMNVIKALDFLALDDDQGALVEARKINRKLEYFNTVHREHANRYVEDAFAHWLMGMLFEREGSYDDARIALSHARRVYRDHFRPRYGVGEPSHLAEDLARVARRSGDQELYRALLAEFPDLEERLEARPGHGEVVLIHLNGVAPRKTDFIVNCAYSASQPWSCDHQPGGAYLEARALNAPSGATRFAVAFPRLISERPRFDHVTLMSEGLAARARTEPALPIDRIAAETLADALPRIFGRAVLRAMAKAGSKKATRGAGQKLAAKGKAGQVLGFMLSSGTDLALDLHEEADKRTWSTLPARIEVARLSLPAGHHDLVVERPDGTVRRVGTVDLRPGQRVFITHRTVE